MKSTIKLIALLILTIIFVIFIIYSSINNLLFLNVSIIILLLILSAIRINLNEVLSSIVLLLPFILIFFFFGVIFQIIHLSGRTDWLIDTIQKMLIFINTFFFIKLILYHIEFKDIVLAPISYSQKAYLIIAKNLFVEGNTILKRLDWYLDSYSYIKENSIIKVKFFRNINFVKYSSLILSLYFILYDLAELCWLLLNNRKSHLEGNTK